jgi:oligoribonuclease NrnB/cAMP/cGMP phosphodiesterase (DHH superfamily)
MKNIIICYHQYCRDGFCGYAVMRYYEKYTQNIKIVQDIPIMQGKVKEALKDKILEKCDEIYCVDINLSIKEIKLFQSLSNAKIFIFDHHEYPNDFEVPDNVYFKHDKTKCGSRLIWEYLYPERELPELLKHIEYRDLWIDAGIDAVYINEYLFAKLGLYNLDEWIKYIDEFDETYKNVGKLLYERKMGEVNKSIKNGYFIEIYYNEFYRRFTYNYILILILNLINKIILFGYTNKRKAKIFVVNADNNISDIGARVVRKNPDVLFAVIWRFIDGKFSISLRSKDYNVESIARFHGGGGHKCAAGFETKTLRMFGLPITC